MCDMKMNLKENCLGLNYEMRIDLMSSLKHLSYMSRSLMNNLKNLIKVMKGYWKWNCKCSILMKLGLNCSYCLKEKKCNMMNMM